MKGALTWGLLGALGCGGGAPLGEPRAPSQVSATSPSATLAFHPDLLSEWVTDTVSQGLGPFTIAGPSGWPLVVEVSDFNFTLHPQEGHLGDGLPATAQAVANAAVSAPPFFDFGKIPVQMSVPLQFTLGPDPESCLALYASLESTVRLDPSTFKGDLGAISQGFLESFVTEQAERALQEPLWRPAIPESLCPTLSPVTFFTASDQVVLLFGARPSSWEAASSPLDTPTSWRGQIHGSLPGHLLEASGGDTQPWSASEARSYLDSEQWVIEAKLGLRRNPQRWRMLRGVYSLVLTESHLSLSQEALEQASAQRPPPLPLLPSVKNRIQNLVERQQWARKLDTTILQTPMRIEVNELSWEVEHLTLQGQIFPLNPPTP